MLNKKKTESTLGSQRFPPIDYRLSVRPILQFSLFEQKNTTTTKKTLPVKFYNTS